MTNAEIFLLPGNLALSFILSLLDMHPGSVDDGFSTLLAALLSFVIWSWVIKLCFVLIQRAFGFGRGAPR